jgi:hypothetical protein
MLEILFRVVNGAATILISVLLFKLYRRMDRRFYLYWSVGFLFYGVNIFLRLWVASMEVSALGLLAFVLNTVGFILIMTGIGELVGKARVTLLVTVVVQVSLTLLGLFAGSSAVAWLALLSPHVLIVLSLGVILFRYHVDISLILLGWVPIFAVNLALAYGALDIVYVDLVSAASKLVVYRGMSEPIFSELADSLHEFLLGGMAAEYEGEHLGGFYLVELGSASRAREIQWINRRVKENRRRGVRTVLFSFYDQITSGDISEENRGDLFLVRVLQGQTGLVNVFDSHETTVNDNPSHLYIVLQDIVEASVESTAPAEVIVYSLSNAIHVHGLNRMYATVTSMKMRLEESHVNLVCFIHPETHGEEGVTARFESMAEGVIRE